MTASVEIAPDRDLAAVALAAGNGAFAARRYEGGRLYVEGVAQAALDAAAAAALPAPAPRRIVPIAVAMFRLQVLGLSAAWGAFVAAAPAATKARLLALQEGFYADDVEVRAGLVAIGANPDDILA